jgi:NADH:ubiquinone oxidoreductase subunit H
MRLYIIGILARILGIIIPFLLRVVFLVLTKRKVMTSMQHKKGLNVVGLFGLLESLADGFKLMIKEPILPSNANLFISIMAPIITFMLSLIAWVVIPCVV